MRGACLQAVGPGPSGVGRACWVEGFLFLATRCRLLLAGRVRGSPSASQAVPWLPHLLGVGFVSLVQCAGTGQPSVVPCHRDQAPFCPEPSPTRTPLAALGKVWVRDWELMCEWGSHTQRPPHWSAHAGPTAGVCGPSAATLPAHPEGHTGQLYLLLFYLVF